MTRPTIKDYEQASGLDFSIKNLTKIFHEELYSHSIPETNLKVISAQAQKDYLGLYRANSQFRGAVTMQLHVPNHFTAVEEEYLAEHKFYEPDHPLDFDNLSNDIKNNIAIRAMEAIKATMWHEYGHAIYEYFKTEHSEEDPEINNHKEVETFNAIKSYFGEDLDGEEEFTEALGQLYSKIKQEELEKISSYPAAIEDRLLHESVKVFVNSTFFPEHYTTCSNPETKKLFIADCFLQGFGDPNVSKYSISENTPYDFKVHEAFLKNEIRLMKDKFFNPMDIVYVQQENSNKKYPMIKIGNTENETSPAIIIDSVAPNSSLNPSKQIYLEDELKIVSATKRKLPTIK